jgi:hypothetical protein
MKKMFAAAAIAAGMMLAPAQAALIDFAAHADTHGETGLANGATLNVGGVNVRLFSAITFPIVFPAFHPYLDAGNAGLGVCKQLDGAMQCDPANDDNVSFGEAVAVMFEDSKMNITGLSFRDANHNLLGLGNDGLVKIFTANGDLTALFSTFIAMAASADAFFADTRFIAFKFVNTQFYVSAINAQVPVPAALPLLVTGLAGLGAAARRKKAA